MKLQHHKWIALILVMTLLLLVLPGCGSRPKSVNQSQAKTSTISIADLQKNLDNPQYVIVDLRPDEAYDGWKIDGISRGGRIKNAVQFPVSWLPKLKDDALKDLLAKKGITPDKQVVLYHSQNDKTEEMAQKLADLGYKHVYKFENLKEWADNTSLPMQALPNYQLLVYPEWVHDLINGKRPATYTGNKFVILETTWGPVSKAYNAGHIPGALHWDTDNMESATYWNFGPPDLVKKSLQKFGITPDTTVVVYSDDVSAAAREVLGLLWAGVKDVRLLNGGLEAWKDAGYVVETKQNQPKPIQDFGVAIPQHPEYILPFPKDVLQKQKDPNFRLVSIRSWQEFIGKTSGYSYIKEAGEPKGAVWGHAGSDASHMEDYTDIDGTLRSPYEIEKLWAEWGVTRNNEVSFYCGTGWRASVAWLDARMLGWPRVTLYDGGWYVWVMDKHNPVQIGDPRKHK